MFKTLNHELNFLANPKPVRPDIYSAEGRTKILSASALARASAEITSWPGYHPTELRHLDGLAAAAGLRGILYKDEGARFGLGSFKALGGAYAVASYLQSAVLAKSGKRSTSGDLATGGLRDLTSDITVTCATDGNHGRSVAWGAQKFGCRCVIYVHATVSQARREAIAAFGAEVRAVEGTYDDAVRQADEHAAFNGWQVISDTSYEGYTDVPRDVMQGYGVIVDEVISQMPDGLLPTHVFIQGGVGGLAASVCAYFWERFGANAPAFFVVEPVKAQCILLSARAGHPVADRGALDTIMAGLACGEVSLLAWQILEAGVDGFISIADEAAADTMRLLASGTYHDRPIVAGESAVAGLAAALIASGDPAARKAMRLDRDSVVLAIGTEGATDPALYAGIVGRSAESIVPGWSRNPSLESTE